MVDELGRRGQLSIALDHGTGDRRVDVGGRLHRFDDGAGRTRFERAPGFGDFDEHEVTERVLRVVGDANLDEATRQQTRPLVALGVFQVGNDLAHGKAPG